jgi:predicted RNase H-like nuclease (RuvC/YqgF family)
VIPYDWVKPLVDSLAEKADSKFGQLRREVQVLRSELYESQRHIANLQNLLSQDEDFKMKRKVERMRGEMDKLKEELARSRATIDRLEKENEETRARDIDL